MPKKPLHNRLRVLRAERGFSQMETAQIAELSSRDRLWRIENGWAEATADERAALARVFGVTESDIFPLADDSQKVSADPVAS